MSRKTNAAIEKQGLANEWHKCEWGDIATLEYGKSLRDYRREGGRYRVYGTNGPIGWHDAPLCAHPGVIIGRKGAYRGVHYSPDPFFAIDTAFYLRPKGKMDMRWAYYCLLTYEINAMDSGSAIPSTSRDDFYHLPVLVPSLEEEKAIAHVLGTLDDKIELNRKMNETLETMARALFKSWFVDFDPVHAKAEGRKPAGMDAATASLFPDSFESSPLGPIPKGWSEKSFADTIDILSGGTPKTSVAEYWHGDIPWFSVTDTPTSGSVFVIDTEKKITPAGVENSAAQILPVGTTIITARGTVGNIALVGVPMAMNQSCYGLRGKAGQRGFFTFFATRAVISTLQQRGHGSVFNTITRDTFAGVKVIAPPKVLVEAFDEKSTSLLDLIHANLFETRTLTFIRNSLLPKFLSGDLRIKNAEQFAESAL